MVLGEERIATSNERTIQLMVLNQKREAALTLAQM